MDRETVGREDQGEEVVVHRWGSRTWFWNSAVAPVACRLWFVLPLIPVSAHISLGNSHTRVDLDQMV